MKISSSDTEGRMVEWLGRIVFGRRTLNDFLQCRAV